MHRDFWDELARWGPPGLGERIVRAARRGRAPRPPMDPSGPSHAAAGDRVRFATERQTQGAVDLLSPAERLAEDRPVAPRMRPSPEEAEAYCRALACRHYENFPVVTWLLPRRLRQDFYNVYAFCRWADDLADETFDPALSSWLLDWFGEQLRACFAGGDITHPVFVALQRTLRRHGLSIEPFADLLSAFRQDQVVREYETRTQLLDYCRRSANPVGRIVLALCDAASPENLADADAVCTGLQLANFWQDVARDWERGRIYLPREDRLRHPGSDESFRTRCTAEPFAALLAEEVAWARGFLQRVFPLADRLPWRLRVDIELFGRGGLRILDRIERIGYRVWELRPVLRARDVGGLLVRTLLRQATPGRFTASPRYNQNQHATRNRDSANGGTRAS